MHRRRSEGPDHRSDRLRLGCRDREGGAAKGVKSIDYDRQVEGGNAVLYASFDGHTVGVLQGNGVVNGLKATASTARIRSSPRCGAARRTRTRSCSRAGSTRSSTRSTPTAPSRRARSSSCPAGTTRRPARSSSRCSSRRATRSTAVAAANDGLANAVVVALKSHKLKPIPLSGQDATTQGVQNIISGWQTMTVFKDVRILATKTAAGRDQDRQGPEAADDGIRQHEGPRARSRPT